MISSRKKYIGVVRVSFDVAITDQANEGYVRDQVKRMINQMEMVTLSNMINVEENIDYDLTHIYTPGHLEDINYDESLEL